MVARYIKVKGKRQPIKVISAKYLDAHAALYSQKPKPKRVAKVPAPA
jgi:hypothetical protein